MDLESTWNVYTTARDAGFKALDVYLVSREEGQRFADILSYCQYAYNPALALAALEITTEISRRADGLLVDASPEVQAGLIKAARRCWSSHFPCSLR